MRHALDDLKFTEDETKAKWMRLSGEQILIQIEKCCGISKTKVLRIS